ncbi:MAG TPA: transglycosylase family protein [Solirubrobacteraceae bacterium]|nr:transglycosylase family protein [Solirubrobacteraceae bacterium]
MTGSDEASVVPDGACRQADVECTIAYRQSLRAARARRRAAALRRRRVLRSRGSLLVAVAALLSVSGGAIARQAAAPAGAMSSETIAAAQRALGVAADGIVGPRTRRATRRFQRRHRLTVDGVIGPQTLKALGIEPRAVAGARARATGAVDPLLEQIARCESGGDPTAVSGDGRYRGKYQFSRRTWRAIGGAGDPARAAEAEQDRLAAKLLRQAGTSPWPNCA